MYQVYRKTVRKTVIASPCAIWWRGIMLASILEDTVFLMFSAPYFKPLRKYLFFLCCIDKTDEMF